VADFIGRANFLSAKVNSVSNGQAEVELLGRRMPVRNSFDHAGGATVSAMLRPETLELIEDPSLPQVTVVQAMYLGSETEYVVRAGDELLTVVDTSLRLDNMFTEGQQVGLKFDGGSVHLLA
jgi:ABC-type Fe3+/spermidine/putrescine transport system ATPase subunit